MIRSTLEKLTAFHAIVAILIIKLAAVVFATQVFAKFTPLVDSELYLQGFYFGDGHIRTQLVQWIAYLAQRLTNPTFTYYVFALISTLGLVYYFLTGGRRFSLLLVLLLPTAAVCTSIVGKEAVYFGFFSFLLVIWSTYIFRPLRRNEIISLVLAFSVCILLRPHYSIALVWLFYVTFLSKIVITRQWLFIALSLLIGFFVIDLFLMPRLIVRGYEGIELARASRFDALGIEYRTDVGLKQFKELLPLGALMGIIGPFPYEAFKRPEFIPFLLEGVLIFCFPFGVAYAAYKRGLWRVARFRTNALFGILPAIAILMMVHAPFGVLNPGSATRWRVNFELLFYLAPLLLLFRSLDAEKDHSLSS